MQIVTRPDLFQDPSSASFILALGNFDGLHLGHQKLLRYVIQQAKQYKSRSAVFTFKEHPQNILHPQAKPLLLNSLEQKLSLIDSLGIEMCFLQSFDSKFAQMEAKEFVKKFLVERFHIKEIYMGQNAHFGHNRVGNPELMRQLAHENKFLFKEMEPVLIGRETVSSSWIRKLIGRGELTKAEACLGRPWSFFAQVIEGEGRGASLGFPTANLRVKSQLLPPEGVYIASVRLLDKGIFSMKEGFFNPTPPGPWRRAVLNFGERPTFHPHDHPKPVPEVHLLDYHHNLYGEMMEVAFHEFLRPEKAFSNDEALKLQIAKDIGQAEAYFQKMGQRKPLQP